VIIPPMDRLNKLLAMRDAEPNDPEIHYMIAMERAKQGDSTQAIAGFDHCITLDPAFCYAYFHKAVTLEESGRRDEARATIEAGIESASAAGDGKALSELSGLLDSYGA